MWPGPGPAPLAAPACASPAAIDPSATAPVASAPVALSIVPDATASVARRCPIGAPAPGPRQYPYPWLLHPPGNLACGVPGGPSDRPGRTSHEPLEPAAVIVGLVVGIVAGAAVGGAVALAVSSGRLSTVSRRSNRSMWRPRLRQTPKWCACAVSSITNVRWRSIGRPRTRRPASWRPVCSPSSRPRPSSRTTPEFLALADARLMEARQAAQGDLDQRRQAIEQLLTPLADQLGRYEQGLRLLELERQRAYTGLSAQVKQLSESQERLQSETRNLVTALRSPATRGRWGEMQLRRVVEMAGMLEHCDFDEQVHTDRRRGQAAARHGGPPARRQACRRRRQGAHAGLPRRHRRHRRHRPARRIS